MDNIKFSDLKDGIGIFIPKKLLEFAAQEGHDIIVTDIDDLQTYVIEQLDGQLYDQNLGITKFEALLDEAIEEVIENGEDCVQIQE